ncbi:MAG: heterocyst frequency control protein PatD [Leptolyngbyaceae cyanobacterium SM1_1_3]|nr:heterocyst frequency control protein PatD [Leptolyngbyaceae cyanobacterium SM1_1_3]NJM85277.1 heterocyst frequency control protein PatD [Leptolyngbyaceae cyanobacterium RM2_2_21]NJN03981.1 heterocyst frequency control protein PatD [Leptolyngbyaceae cyanobacterium RM1_1_2]NJO08703.1 heterocyst frequency control protein PatD [Leptolyngbyaceae cyanobacterium SL_1_1]
MLLPEHQQILTHFQAELQQLIAQTAQSNPEFQQLQASFLQLQQRFQQQILLLPDDALRAEEQTQLQAYQTEMNRLMRLLAVDISFLQTARQSVKQQQRQAQIQQRLSGLLQFCQALLAGHSIRDGG